MSSKIRRSGGRPPKKHHHTGVPAAGTGETKQGKMAHSKMTTKTPKPPCPACGTPMGMALVSLALGRSMGKRLHKRRFCYECRAAYRQNHLLPTGEIKVMELG